MTNNLPPLYQLRAFEAVARHLSFKQAAAELNVTRAAISHQIKALESHFKFKLFHRMGRSIKLTDEGSEYVGHVSAALLNLSSATIALKQKRREKRLILSVAPSFGARWLMPRLHEFQTFAPDVKLEATWTTDVTDIPGGQADVAIRHGVGNWPNVASTLLYREELAPAYRASLFEVADGQHPTAEDLFARSLFCARTLSGEWARWAKDFAPDLNMPAVTYLPTHAHSIDAALVNDGSVLADRRIMDNELRHKQLVYDPSRKIVSPRGIHLVHRQGEADRYEIKVFSDWLREQFKISERDFAAIPRK